MNILLQFSLASVFLSLFACTQQKVEKSASIISLIANPRLYDGRQVSTAGWLKLNSDSHGLFLTKEDCMVGNRANAIWLDPNSAALKNYVPTMCRFFGIEATFKDQSKSVGNVPIFFNGGLHQITSAADLETEREILNKANSLIIDRENTPKN